MTTTTKLLAAATTLALAVAASPNAFATTGALATPEGTAAGDAPFDTTGRTVQVFTTASEGGQRLARGATPLTFGPAAQPPETEVSIFIDPAQRFQTLLGIGGAITDASAEVFAKLPAAQQAELLTRYYDADKGIGYTWARTTIHSSDFSSASYTYVREGDAKLASFDIAHDLKYRIPLIKRATAAAGGK